MKICIFITIMAFSLSAYAGPAELVSSPDNLLAAVSKPTDQQDAVIKVVVRKLTKSRVPTREGAEKLALEAFLKKPGLGASEKLKVVGLFFIGRELPDFAKEGDLVWEIRVMRFGNGGDFISGVIWVSATTRMTKVLFPAGS